MKFRTVARAGIQAAINLRRNRQMALAAFFITTLSLIVLGVALLFITNLNYATDTLARRVVIRAFLKDELSPAQQTYVKDRVGKMTSVKAVRFVPLSAERPYHAHTCQIFLHVDHELPFGLVGLLELIRDP
jgi:cell division protein FtsX